jgi:hypothetical protein
LVAPSIAGNWEARGQAVVVDRLFRITLQIVAGALIDNWRGIRSYIDKGRFWFSNQVLILHPLRSVPADVPPIVAERRHALADDPTVPVHPEFNDRLAYTDVIGAALRHVLGAGVFTLNAPLLSDQDHCTLFALNHVHATWFAARGGNVSGGRLRVDQRGLRGGEFTARAEGQPSDERRDVGRIEIIRVLDSGHGDGADAAGWEVGHRVGRNRIGYILPVVEECHRVVG